MRSKLLTLFISALLSASPTIQAAGKQSDLKLGMIHCCIEPDVFMWSIAENIRNAAKADGTKIEFINADGMQSKQLEAVKQLQDKGVDGIIMSIVIDDTLEKPFQKQLIDALKQTGLPVVFYLLAVEDRFLATYPKAYRVGSIPAQSGIMQGEMVSDAWLKHPEWDKNGDGVMQYAILKGPAGNPDAEGRTKWVRATLDTFPTGAMLSEIVALETADFKRLPAQQIAQQWIADGTADRIEVLIANNDDMMLGAYDVLANYAGKPVFFGIDALPETLELIRKGEVAGTVQQDLQAQSASAYRLAANLAAGKDGNSNIEFPLVRQELIVPYNPVTRENVDSIK